MEQSIIEKGALFYQRARNRVYTIILRHCLYASGNNLCIMPPFKFANLNFVKLGNHVTIHSFCWMVSISDFGVPSEQPNINIGDYTSIGMRCSIMAAGKIDIGAHVVIAPNVYISDHSHKYDDISCPISEQGIDKISRVIIGEESWIGHGAVILPGTNIGKHCVIGANSVVSGNIKDYSIVVGIPANVKKRFNFDTNTWEKVG